MSASRPEPLALLSIRGLSKFFSGVPVVDRVSLDVAHGEIVMIVGPSGAGKSTLLRCINRIEVPSAGDVLLDGVNMAGEMLNGKLAPDSPNATARKRQRIGMVFQRFNLFVHLTALDNVAIGPHRVLGVTWSDARALATEQLARVRLSEHVTKRPAQLWGGQQQRVAIGRAMAMDLLHHGVDRCVIALWLGHESVETTVIYLQADMKLKEQALAKTSASNAHMVRYKPADNLLAFLRSL